MGETGSRSRRQNFFLILMLGVLQTVTPFSIDLYLPAFPEIARALDTSLARVGFSVSTYFFGYAFGQVLYGPLLDRFGRKRPLYFGMALYVLASLACASARTVEQLMLYRVLQALGGCVSGIASTAMVKDFFHEREAAKVFSLLMLVLSASPLLAPTVGAFLARAWGWQASFYALALLGAAVLAMIRLALPHGHRGDPARSLSPGAIAAGFAAIFRDPRFRVPTLAGSFSFAGLFVYVAGSPAIFLDGFGVSTSAYGAIFALLAVGMIGGGQLNILLMRRHSSARILRAALIAQVAIGAAFLYGAGTGLFGLAATIVALFAVLSCAGLVYPNAAALALSPFRENAGSASALLGFIQLGIGSVVSAAVGIFEMKGALPTAGAVFFSAAVGLTILLWRRPGGYANG